jgi:branched-chain amino acid aminotransferase
MDVILNGERQSSEGWQNRAFRYGDGLFETMRFFDGQILNLQAHRNRLAMGIRILRFQHPDRFMREWQDAAESLAADCGNNARIRLSVFRSGSGFYLPEDNRLEWLLEAWPMQAEPYPECHGLRMGLARGVRRPLWNLSSFKILGSLPSILAQMEAAERGLDDLVLLNFTGRVSAASKGNIFLVMNGELHSPLPGEGQVEGTMKQAVSAACLKLGIKVISRQIPEKDLGIAEEIFTSNAIQGLSYASEFEGRPLSHEHYHPLHIALREMLIA